MSHLLLTINIILQYVYNNQHLPPPNINKEHLQELLNIYTKEALSKNIDNTLYKQIDSSYG